MIISGVNAAPLPLLAICGFAHLAVAIDPGCEPAYRCVQPPDAEGPIQPHERGPWRPASTPVATATGVSGTASLVTSLGVWRAGS